MYNTLLESIAEIKGMITKGDEEEEMKKEEIAENINTIIRRVEGSLERGRMNIRSIFVKTTMGPPEKII